MRVCTEGSLLRASARKNNPLSVNSFELFREPRMGKVKREQLLLKIEFEGLSFIMMSKGSGEALSLFIVNF